MGGVGGGQGTLDICGFNTKYDSAQRSYPPPRAHGWRTTACWVQCQLLDGCTYALVSLIISRVHGDFNIQFIMVLAVTVSTAHATHVRMRVWAVGAGAGADPNAGADAGVCAVRCCAERHGAAIGMEHGVG